MLIYLRSKKIEMYIIEKDQMQEFATDMKAIYQCFVYYLGPSDHTPQKAKLSQKAIPPSFLIHHQCQVTVL